MKRIISVVLFLILTTKIVSAINIDSLRKVLDEKLADTSKINTLLLISENIYYTNPDSDVIVCNQVVQLAEKKLQTELSEKLRKYYSIKLATAYNNLAFNNLSSGKTNKAILQFEKAAELYSSEKDSVGLSLVLSSLGVAFDNFGKIDEGLDYHYKSLKIREKIKDTIGISKCYNNIGYAYYSQNDYHTALEYYFKAKPLQEAKNYKSGLANTINNIGMSYKNLAVISLNNKDTIKHKEYSKISEDYLTRTLEIYKELNYLSGLGYAYINLGGLYSDKNELDIALDYFMKSLEIRIKIKEKMNIVFSLSNISSAYYSQKNYIKAKEYGLKAMKLADSLGFPEAIRTSALSLNDVYKVTNDWKNAYEMYELFNKMDDSIKSKNNEKAMLKSQMQYDYEQQKMLDKIENDKILAIENEKQEKQKVIIYSISVGLALMLLSLVVIVNRWKLTLKQKEIIAQVNDDLNKQNEEIKSQKDIITEQKKIVDEAHQDIKDSINYAKRIQKAILPSDKQINQLLPNSFVFYKPKDVVSGDFYWLEHKKNLILFAVADCTGHGVPGAMVSVVCHNALNRCVREFNLTKPSDILDKTRELILDEFSKSDDDVKDGMDISLCAFDKHTNKLLFAGAHNPLWVIRNRECIEYKADRQPIGKFYKEFPFSNYEIEIQQNDIFYISSDGFSDQFGGSEGKKLGKKQFKEFLCDLSIHNITEQPSIISDYFENWRLNNKYKQIDDVCVMGFKIS